MENKDIQEAKIKFEEIQANEQERELARLREKYVLEINDSEKRGVRRVVKNLKRLNISIETIVKATGLDNEEIEKL